MNTDLIIKARAYGEKAHENLFRKNGAEPYAVHLEEVAGLVEQSGGSAEEIAAAWLHDVVEDTPVDLATIEREFGSDVALLVDSLTDPLEYKGLPTLERKLLQAGRIKEKSSSVKRIKIADQISNVRSLGIDSSDVWPAEKCLAYTEGAKHIVENCGGVSVFLEQEFAKAYQAAAKKYR